MEPAAAAKPAAAAEPEVKPSTADPVPVDPTPVDQEDLLLYAVVDRCLGSRAATVDEALELCRSITKTGTPWQRRSCHCEAKNIIEVRSSDPIAYWYASDCFESDPAGSVVLGASRDVAVQACERENERRKASPEEPNDECECNSNIAAVRGPYKRVVEAREFEDVAINNYLSELGEWLDKEGAPSCFAAGTLVSTPTGDRAIEEIEPGDLVITYDEKHNRATTAIVLHTKTRTGQIGTLTLTNGNTVKTTANHPFYNPSSGKWSPAIHFSNGSRLLSISGEEVEIDSIDFDSTKEGPVYTLSVSAPHTFFANGLLVHNY